MKRIAVVLLSLLSIVAVAQTKPVVKKPVKKAVEKCLAGVNELCASDKFYAEYQRYKDYQVKYAPPKDVQLIMKGITADLNEEIQVEMKQGFTWNEQKMRFVKPEPPVAAKPATPPQVAPVAPVPDPKPLPKN
jgi:hypothetical protein